jgi:LmbE family N-acetylglucosaminyl deacetylase
MRQVYISPHLDDAVLSCGGAIHQQTTCGDRVQVLTPFAGEFVGDGLSSFAQVQHQQWGYPPKPMFLRRAEDRAALGLLDAEAQHLDYLDAVYRAGPDGEWLYPDLQSLWEDVHPADPLAQTASSGLADRLAALLPSKHEATVYAPLGVGRHVDHQIVHTAARRLLTLGYQMAFYEDYPYAESPGATDAAVVAVGAEPWRMEAIPLSPEDLAAKVSAIDYYRTQLSSLFDGAQAMPNRVWTFAASRSPRLPLAERLWWPPDGA